MSDSAQAIDKGNEHGHTPGPWFVGAQNDALFIIDRPPAQSNDYPNHDADRACIAKVYDDARGHAGRDNARLIAAAPDLLDVVKRGHRKLRTYTSVYPGDKELRGLLVAWEAAITKATGAA